jgi:putative membrane protein
MNASLRAEHFFTHEEKEKLKAAVQAAELRSIGEIVVMVVDHSDHYREAEVLGGVLLGSVLSLILTLLFFSASSWHASIWVFIPLAFLFFFPFRFLLQKSNEVKRHFTGAGSREEAVRLRAERAFFEHGLYRTKKNTGVLFLISLFERKVRILADKGIYEKMSQDTLNRFANEVSLGIKEGRACESLCLAIQETGDVLSTHFPVTPDDTDELPDEVITEE